MGFETGAGAFMQGGSYSAAQARRAAFAWAARTAANVEGTIAGGLLSATDMQMTAAGSGLVVNTSVGACLIGGSEATSQGGYHAFLSSTSSTTLATANATNPRIDLICATVGDALYTIPAGGTSGAVTLQAVTGTPTAGATLTNLSGAPSLPLSSLLLGYVLVPATATNITNTNIANKATQVQLQPVTAGQVVASSFYSPGSLQTYAVSSSTWTYMDTTNLAITATVPSSGNVILRAHGGMIQTNSPQQVLAGVNTSSSGTPTVSQPVGTAANSLGVAGGGGGMQNMPYHVEVKLIGLAPGASQTFYFAIYINATNGDMYVDGAVPLSGGPVLMTVQAA